MSQKISVVSISLALLSLMLFSCAKRDDSFLSVFQRPFSANVTVLNADGEYCATVTLAEPKQPTTDTGASNEQGGEPSGLRDGNVSYTFPETITGISALRSGGDVTVNVCGIDVRPSENIASKYTYLLDLLDIHPVIRRQRRRDPSPDPTDRRCLYRSGEQASDNAEEYDCYAVL